MEDQNAPVTKGELEAALAQQETRIVDRMKEIVWDAQNESLKAFYGFTETVQSRFKAQDDTEAGLKRRITVLEERILEIERRLNMPPAA